MTHAQQLGFSDRATDERREMRAVASTIRSFRGPDVTQALRPARSFATQLALKNLPFSASADSVQKLLDETAVDAKPSKVRDFNKNPCIDAHQSFLHTVDRYR